MDGDPDRSDAELRLFGIDDRKAALRQPVRRRFVGLEGRPLQQREALAGELGDLSLLAREGMDIPPGGHFQEEAPLAWLSDGAGGQAFGGPQVFYRHVSSTAMCPLLFPCS